MMGILMGALAGAGRAAGEISDSNRKLWGQQELAQQQSDMEMAKAKMLAEFSERKEIAAEQRGLSNRATERQAITNETISNAPALRQVRVDDSKAAKMVEYDPELQALMRKAETEKLTAAEQTQLDFFTKNEPGILNRQRKLAQAGNIDNGAGLRGIQIEAARMSIDERKQANTMLADYEKTDDPVKKAAIRESLINRGIIKPSSGSAEFDTEKVMTEKMNPDGTTTKTEHTQRRRAGDNKPEKGEPVTFKGQLLGYASTEAEAMALLQKARGGQVTSGPSANTGDLSTMKSSELKRMASKPRGVSSNEAASAQKELDSRVGQSRVSSF